MLDLKQREFVAAKTGANVVMENRAIAQEFEKEVASLGKRSEAAAATAVRESEGEIRQGRIILICLALVSLATALVIGWYYVGRGVVRRLVRLQYSMKSIAAGDLSAEIATSGSDEIADMAEALLVFKNNMLESSRLRAERSEAEKHVHAQRKNEMKKLADEFEAAVGEIIQSVSLCLGWSWKLSNHFDSEPPRRRTNCRDGRGCIGRSLLKCQIGCCRDGRDDRFDC
jgi:methyl-accepting chemotaxis protein